MKSMIVAAAMLAWAGAAPAQDAERVFVAGELVRVAPTETYKIIGCHLEKVSREPECDFVQWKNGGPVSRKVTMLASQLAVAEARQKENDELAAMVDPATP